MTGSSAWSTERTLASMLAETLPLNDAQWWLVLVFVAFLGGCVGSFLNVVMYRLPRGENVVWPGSHCPKCQHAIRPWHNLPVIGWLLLGGKCYDCKEPISPKYPLVEAATATVFVLVALASGML
jgi:leader peptidase (prepilin peptidase) / N-methyltransferase